jgi:hypothetical protein
LHFNFLWNVKHQDSIYFPALTTMLSQNTGTKYTVTQGNIVEELILHPHCRDETCTVMHSVWSQLLLPQNWMWKFLYHNTELYETSLSPSSSVLTACFWLAWPVYCYFTIQLHTIRDALQQEWMNL